MAYFFAALAGGDNVERTFIVAASAHYQGDGSRRHWWATTYSPKTGMEWVISDDLVVKFQDSPYTTYDLQTSWTIALYVEQVSKVHKPDADVEGADMTGGGRVAHSESVRGDDGADTEREEQGGGPGDEGSDDDDDDLFEAVENDEDDVDDVANEVRPEQGTTSDLKRPVGEGSYRCRLCPDVILKNLVSRSRHETYHKRGSQRTNATTLRRPSMA